MNRLPMKIRSHIRSVRLVFSIFLLQILAGLTGCKDDGTEFLEKELVQEESTEASGMDAEQEEPKDTESEVSGKASAGAAADISQKKQNESAEEPAPEVEKQLPEISDTPQTIYVDICGAVTSPGVYELPYGSRVFQAIEQAGGYLPEAAGCRSVSVSLLPGCLPENMYTRYWIFLCSCRLFLLLLSDIKAWSVNLLMKSICNGKKFISTNTEVNRSGCKS